MDRGQRVSVQHQFNHQLINRVSITHVPPFLQRAWCTELFLQVLQESYMMIPDSKGRMSKALEDLESFLKQHESTEGLPQEQLEQARGILLEAGVVA